MTKKEVELMAMLIRIHTNLNALHEQNDISDDFCIKYIGSKLSFELTEKDIQQIKKYLEKCRKENTQKKCFIFL